MLQLLHKWQHLFVIDWMMFPLFPIKFGTLWSMESEQYFLLLQFFKATNEMAQKCAHFFPLEIALELEENCCWKFMCNGFYYCSPYIFLVTHIKRECYVLRGSFHSHENVYISGMTPKKLSFMRRSSSISSCCHLHVSWNVIVKRELLFS